MPHESHGATADVFLWSGLYYHLKHRTRYYCCFSHGMVSHCWKLVWVIQLPIDLKSFGKRTRSFFTFYGRVFNALK